MIELAENGLAYVALDIARRDKVVILAFVVGPSRIISEFPPVIIPLGIAGGILTLLAAVVYINARPANPAE